MVRNRAADYAVYLAVRFFVCALQMASPRVATTSKTLSTSTYWRCDACGEIWNPGRVNAGSTGRARRW